MREIKKMPIEEIEELMAIDFKQIERDEELSKTDFYQLNDVPLESIYLGKALRLFSLACGYSLKEDYPQAKQYFYQAAECQLKPFKMAYKEIDENYVKDISLISEGIQSDDAIQCFSTAMCAGDISVAKQLCHYYQQTKSDTKRGIINDYIMALKALFNDEVEKAAAFCQAGIQKYNKKPSKKNDFRSNFYTLHFTLLGIITKDQTMFDDGVTKLVSFCHHDAIYGEYAGMMESRVADFAIALVNLGLLHGLKQNIFDDFLPQGLIFTAPEIENAKNGL